MRWILRFFVALFVLTLFFGVFLSRSNVQVRPSISVKKHKLFNDYRGITHVVTKYSRGSGSPSDIIAAAAQAQISFLYFTDLNDFDPLHELSGYSQGVLVLPAKKISYLDSHLIFYGSKELQHLDSLGTANALVTDQLQRPSHQENSILTLAHPFKKGFQWDEENSKGLNGVEVMNLRHMWQSVWLNKKASFLWSLFLYIFNPDIALLRLINEPSKELKFWDQLNQEHKTTGLLGNHTTGKIFHLGPISFAFPTYEQSFAFASNHILLRSELTGIRNRDTEKVFGALKRGNFYFAIDSLADPKGFAAYIEQGKSIHSMGENINLDSNTQLKVDLPDIAKVPYEIKLFRNGREIAISKKLNTQWKITEPGVYRVYARLRLKFPIPGELRWIPWIYTNNFYIK